MQVNNQIFYFIVVCFQVFISFILFLTWCFKSFFEFSICCVGMYTVEFQKRGLPHVHILLWLKPQHKFKTSSDIDKHISAELPDPKLYPKLYKAVSSYMIHGPCGVVDPNSPCMADGRCSKNFPKKYQNCTTVDDDGFPLYKRRQTGISVLKKGVPLDNAFVVPYNPHLLMRYQGHINVEHCNKSNAIKYLFKYINKGPDRVNVRVSNSVDGSNNVEARDEIKEYYDCRFVYTTSFTVFFF